MTNIHSRRQNSFLRRLRGKIGDFSRNGVYAILATRVLRLSGYSRDIYLSLKQHLVRQTQYCYWLKVKLSEAQPHILESIRSGWLLKAVPSPKAVSMLPSGTIHRHQNCDDCPETAEGIVPDEIATKINCWKMWRDRWKMKFYRSSKLAGN